MNNSKPILLFDGVCNLCNRVVRFTIRHDPAGKFMFAPLQSEAGKNILEKFNLPKEDFDTFVLVEGDRCFLRSSAGLRVLQGLGFPWNLFYIFIIIPSPIRDIVYRFIARNRYNVFGKRETCMVPSQELSHRFLQ